MRRLLDSIKIGDKFYDLTVESIDFKNNKAICRCKCGNVYIAQPNHLFSHDKSRANKSCGCRKTKGLLPLRIAINERLASYEQRAIDKDLKWDINKEYATILIKSPCFYCGQFNEKRITQKYKRLKNRPYKFALNGIDRLDNKLGYIITNVVPCCTFCNRAKSDNSIEFFIEKIKSIYNNLDLNKEINLLSIMNN